MSQLPPDDNPYQADLVPEKPTGKHDQWGEPRRTSGKAIASLILSLLSVFLCGIPGLIALILGFTGLSDIKTSSGRLKGSGFATSGIIISFVSFALIALAMPVLLLLPAINAAREAARRGACLSNARQLALGAWNHESSTKRFPLGSDAVGPFVGDGAAVPGSSEGDTAAGYSWQVKLLPYMEESIFSDQIRQSSEKMSIPAFDQRIVANGQHPSQVQLVALRCPSYAGNPIANAPEYEAAIGNVAVGNYVGLPGTHIKADGTLEENGVFVSGWSRKEKERKGLRLGEIGDGTSKTVLLCESREERYGSWYDGQATWVTALKTDIDENSFTQGLDGFPEVPLDASAMLAGPDDYYASGMDYFPAGKYPGQLSREWGPSSMHSMGVVTHAFADGHAQVLTSDMDANVYMRLITRAGGEPIDGDF